MAFDRTTCTIEVSGYGLSIFSLAALAGFLKEGRIRAKKLCDYFDRNEVAYLRSKQSGAWAPLMNIPSISYLIAVNDADIFATEVWEQASDTQQIGCVDVKDGAIWVATLDLMNAWRPRDYDDVTELTYHTLDGERCVKAAKIAVHDGKYKVSAKCFRPQRNDANAEGGYHLTLDRTESTG